MIYNASQQLAALNMDNLFYKRYYHHYPPTPHSQLMVRYPLPVVVHMFLLMPSYFLCLIKTLSIKIDSPRYSTNSTMLLKLLSELVLISFFLCLYVYNVQSLLHLKHYIYWRLHLNLQVDIFYLHSNLVTSIIVSVLPKSFTIIKVFIMSFGYC